MQTLLDRWMPMDGSAHGHELDQMNALVHWLMLLLFVGWGIYFVWVLLRYRAGRNPEASYVGAQSKYSTWVEGGVVLAEVIILVGFAIPAWARWVTPHPADENPLIVRVVGEQFAWNVHYPGPDGVFGQSKPELMGTQSPLGLDPDDPAGADDVVTINQLHLPVNRPVTIRLSSKDVIHSFSLPYMRVKQDAIPGAEIPIHFKPVVVTPEESTFPKCAADKTCWEISCAQLCGLGHYRMRGFLTVHPPGGFESWLAEKTG